MLSIMERFVAAASPFMSDDRAQSGTNLAGYMIGFLVSAIIGIAVVIPTINDVLASANITGTTATILSYVTTLLAVLLLVAVAGPLLNRTG